MATPQTVPVVTIPAPIRGMDAESPLAAMDPNYAPWLLNWEPEPQFIRVRNGHEVHCVVDATYVAGLGTLKSGSGVDTLVAYGKKPTDNSKIWDIDTSTPSLLHTLSDYSADEAYPVYFNRRFCFATEFASNLCSALYDGSSWSAWAFTYGGANINGRVVTQYKGRVYVFGAFYLYYSDLTGVMGAMSRVDLSTLFEGSGNVAWAAPLTSSTQNADSTYLAFGTSDGEIFVYSGDNPGAPNWTQVARFKTDLLLYWNSIVQLRNDVWVLTVTGVVSLRQLLSAQTGDVKATSVSTKIDAYWTKVMKAIITDGGYIMDSYASAAYWPEQNKVYILVKGAILEDGTWVASGGTMFVHNLISKAWCVQIIPSVRQGVANPSLVYCNNCVYYAISNVVMKVGTDFLDEDYSSPGSYANIDIELRSAYSNFGNANKNKQIVGFEPIVNSDFPATAMTMAAAADMGRQVSANTKMPLNLTGYQIPHCHCGVQGTFLQYRIDGLSQSGSVGFELFSMGVAVK